MLKNLPEISKQIFVEDILHVLENKYSSIGTLWAHHQMEWSNDIFSYFNDHDKFLIIIYLTKKTLDLYSKNFVRLSYDQFYSKDAVEIEKFNVIEVSKNINIPKESARRKIVELEKANVIKRYKNKIIINKSAFSFVSPISSIKRVSHFLSIFSKTLVDEKILLKPLRSTELEKIIKKNFSFVLKIYYEMQIPMLLNYKKVFKDLESFHIWGLCVVNQHLHFEKKK